MLDDRQLRSDVVVGDCAGLVNAWFNGDAAVSSAVAAPVRGRIARKHILTHDVLAGIQRLRLVPRHCIGADVRLEVVSHCCATIVIDHRLDQRQRALKQPVIERAGDYLARLQINGTRIAIIVAGGAGQFPATGHRFSNRISAIFQAFTLKRVVCIGQAEGYVHIVRASGQVKIKALLVA